MFLNCSAEVSADFDLISEKISDSVALLAIGAVICKPVGSRESRPSIEMDGFMAKTPKQNASIELFGRGATPPRGSPI
jgi:hypothetical protein